MEREDGGEPWGGDIAVLRGVFFLRREDERGYCEELERKGLNDYKLTGLFNNEKPESKRIKHHKSAGSFK